MPTDEPSLKQARQPLTIQTEMRKLSDLRTPAWNPRFMPDFQAAKLRSSLEEFGYAEPIVVNTRTNNIVGGNQRAAAMKALGYTEAEVVLVSLPLEREKALNLALNKIHGEWEPTLLADLIRDLQTSAPAALDLTGFTPDEIAELTKVEIPDFSPPEGAGGPKGGRLNAKDLVDVKCPNCKHEFTVAK